MFSSVSTNGLNLSLLSNAIASLDTLKDADVSNIPNKGECLISIAHPFLYLKTQGNQTDKRLNPINAGEIISNKLSQVTPEASLILMMITDSYSQLKTELDNLYSLLPLPDFMQLIGMCEYMSDIQNLRKVTNFAEVWPLSKLSHDYHINGFDVLTGVNDLVVHSQADIDQELLDFENEASDYLSDESNSINDLNALSAALSNTKCIFLQGSGQADDLKQAASGLPESAPYCVAVSFMGSADVLSNYKNLFGA